MMDGLVLVVVLGVAGLLFGSFANVVIYRVPAGRSVVRPGSACPSCGASLTAFDNVPVMSWVFLRGRCRRCRARIPLRYPLVELLTAVLFAALGARLPETDLIAYVPLAWFLVVLTFIDIDHKLLPNKLVLPATVMSLVLFGVASAIGPGFAAYGRGIAAAAGSFVGFLLLALISPRGMGMGDVKLSFVLGLSMGYLGADGVISAARTFVGFFLAFALGAVFGIVFAVAKRAGFKAEIPFGPYLAVGALVSILWGDPLVRAWLG